MFELCIYRSAAACAGVFSLGLGFTSSAMAQSSSPASAAAAAQQEPLKEISIAAEAFVRGAPVPAWADVMPLPPQTSKSSSKPVVVRMADSHMRSGPQAAYLVNRAEQVNESSQLGHIGQTQLHFNPAFQRLLMHRITLVRNGQGVDHTATAQVRFLQRETALEQGIYSGVITANVVLPDVRVGDTLHLVYSTEGENPIFGQRYTGSASWEQPWPMELRRVTMNAPVASSMRWRWVGGLQRSSIQPTVQERDGWRRMRFEEADVQPVELEAHMPANVMPYRSLQFSEYASWSEVVTWAQGLFPRGDPLPSELQPVLARLRALPNAQGKVSAALQWVQTEVRYWSVALGESSHRPALPAEVVQRRWGDCKDKSLLLVRLLQELGIEAHPVLASLQSRTAAQGVLPAPTVFDHVIVRVPLDGRDHWLDPTRIGQTGSLESMGQHMEESSVLPVQAGVTALIDILSPNRAQLFASEMTERFSINNMAGEGHLHLEQSFVGLAAEGLRAVLQQWDDRQRRQWALGTYERRYPGIALEAAPSFELDELNNRIVVKAAYAIPKLVQDAGAAWSMRYFPSNFAGSFAIPERVSNRLYPLAMPSWPATLQYQLEVTWPENVSVVADPRTQRLDAKHFGLESTRSFRGNQMRQTLNLRPKTAQVPAAEVQRLIEDIGMIDGLVGGLAMVDKGSLKNAGVLGFGKSSLQDQMAQRLKQAVERSGKAIESQRLSGEDLAEALCARAEARSDMGQPSQGLADALEAVKLAPQASRAWECRANLYFALGEFAKSSADYSKALGLGADAFTALYRRGHARFYEGKLELAAADFTKAAADKEDESDRLFAQLWQVWTLHRLKQALPKPLVEISQQKPRGAWPRPALAMLTGVMSVEELLRWIDQNKQGDERELALAEAWFYIGQRQWVDGQRDDARQSFEKAREKRITVYIEHMASGFELKAMGVEPR